MIACLISADLFKISPMNVHICMPRFCKSMLGFARLGSVAHEPVTGREQTELRRLSMEREDITVRSAASAAPAPLLALSRGW